MKRKSSNRGWVKNAAIIFLLILLVLTFFSNTIMNRSLPEVAVKVVDSGSIVAKVRGTGTVEASGFYEVTAEATHEILTVMVKSGDRVEVGDVLFVLGEGASEEILKLSEEIRQLELNYQRAALGIPVFNYENQQREIDRAKEALDKAHQEVEAAKENYDNSSTMITPEQRTAAYNRVVIAEGELAEAQNMYDSQYPQIKADIDSAQDEILSILAESSANTAASNAGSSQSPENSAVIPAETNDFDTDTHETDEPENENSTEAEQEPILAEEPVVTPPPVSSTENDDRDERLARARRRLADAEERLQILQDNIDKAKANLERAQNEYKALIESDGPLAQAYLAALEKEQELQDKYDALVNTLNIQKTNDGRTAAAASLELQDIAYQIKVKKEELAKLTGEFDNKITANVSGIVREVKVTAGKKVNKDEVMCTIEVPDMGYTLSFTATRDQVSRVHIGDTATVSNYYWGSQIVATLVSIENDPKNPQQGRVLTFNLTGDVSAGTELTISVGQKSATYDTVIPNTALRSDSNGTYVLVVTAKNSSLGNRYFATRVAVTVLASDDVNSAVTGELNPGDYVITTSASPVANGQQVRMAD